MTSPSTSDSPSPLSAPELTNLIFDSPMANILHETFEDDVTGAAHLRHYGYISKNIMRLQLELDRHHEEQKELFNHIMENDYFRTAIQPIVHIYRLRFRTSPGFQPYAPFSSGVFQRNAIPHTSPPTSSSSSSLNNKPLAAMSDSEETSDVPKQPTCEQCGQFDHDKPNCDTKIQSFTHCNICDWMNQPQRPCYHYDLSPVGFQKLRGDIPYDDSN
jgi:hypothetical protein